MLACKLKFELVCALSIMSGRGFPASMCLTHQKTVWCEPLALRVRVLGGEYVILTPGLFARTSKGSSSIFVRGAAPHNQTPRPTVEARKWSRTSKQKVDPVLYTNMPLDAVPLMVSRIWLRHQSVRNRVARENFDDRGRSTVVLSFSPQ